METLKIKKFTFKEVEGACNRSISGDFAGKRTTGIYAYELSDGRWYVGKTTNVVDRHSDHLHEWKKKGEFHPVRFFWHVLNVDGLQLDFAETKAIAAFEAKGYELLNISKAGRPRGDDTAIVEIDGSFGITVPWNRENLPKESKGKFVYEDSPGKRKRFARLKELDEYEQIIGILRWYVRETIPSPADTAGTLWTVTSYPDTGDRDRLVCLSCQNVETLVIKACGGRYHPDSIWGFVNVKKPEDGELPKWDKETYRDYESLSGHRSLKFNSLDEAEALLHDEVALDCCYRVNAELFRRGASMFRRFNNPYLTEAVLKGL